MMTFRSMLARSLFALSILLIASGCSTFSETASEADRLRNSHTLLELTLDSGYDLNPNDRGEASPLIIPAL